MQELDDIVLLREYAERHSEEAFATLVARHVNKVYSVALRHTRNPHQAEEIAQAVFVILAKKSKYLRKGVILEGWLYQTTRLTAVTFIRSEIRRVRREQEAYMQNLLNETESDVWPQIAPLLDAALGGLNETDRNAVVMRFFYGKSMKEVGIALGASEDAVKMRVNRAVEKLRVFFTRRGVVFPASVLTASISTNSAQAAPALLAKTATAIAFSKGATASTSTLILIQGAMKAMAWTKAKTAIVIGVAAVLAVSSVELVAVKLRDRSEVAVDNAMRRLRSSKPQDYFPRSAWVFAGYGDPKSTVMTSLWAVRQNDGETIIACLSPLARQKTEQELASQVRTQGRSVFEILARKSHDEFKDNTGFRILDATTISNDLVAVHLFVPNDVRVEYAYLLKKIGSEWKIESFRK
jgi:RNA polymerase sigma factor (sigma-70 family)